MIKTASEKHFETLCAVLGIQLLRIAEEANSKTPDYEIFIESQRVVVEVKEITRNKDEQILIEF